MVEADYRILLVVMCSKTTAVPDFSRIYSQDVICGKLSVCGVVFQS